MKESFSRASSGGRVVRHSINEENVRGGVWNGLPAKYCGDAEKETEILKVIVIIICLLGAECSKRWWLTSSWPPTIGCWQRSWNLRNDISQVSVLQVQDALRDNDVPHTDHLLLDALRGHPHLHLPRASTSGRTKCKKTLLSFQIFLKAARLPIPRAAFSSWFWFS